MQSMQQKPANLESDQSVTQSLCKAIGVWVLEKDNRSLALLARLSKVSYSTIRRIMQNETVPNSDTALKLADILMAKAERTIFAEKYTPTFAKNLAEVAYKSDDTDMLEYINDKAFIPLILLASHAQGTNEAEVRFFFGHESSAKFAELVDSGHLVRCGSNWKLEKDIGSVSRETAREMLSVFTQICPAANDSISCASLAHVGWESVNLKTALAVFHLAVTFARDAIRLTSDPENKGDIMIFFGSLFNVIKGVEKLK